MGERREVHLFDAIMESAGWSLTEGEDGVGGVDLPRVGTVFWSLNAGVHGGLREWSNNLGETAYSRTTGNHIEIRAVHSAYTINGKARTEPIYFERSGFFSQSGFAVQLAEWLMLWRGKVEFFLFDCMSDANKKLFNCS